MTGLWFLAALTLGWAMTHAWFLLIFGALTIVCVIGAALYLHATSDDGSEDHGWARNRPAITWDPGGVLPPMIAPSREQPADPPSGEGGTRLGAPGGAGEGVTAPRAAAPPAPGWDLLASVKATHPLSTWEDAGETVPQPPPPATTLRICGSEQVTWRDDDPLGPSGCGEETRAAAKAALGNLAAEIAATKPWEYETGEWPAIAAGWD